MDHFVDIVLLPDAEMPLNWLTNAVYTKLHKALSDMRSTEIGVSFPNYQIMLGNVLRLHGSEQDLNHLQKDNWLGGMAGYCNVSDVLAVISDVRYRTVSRKQSTMSQSKLRRLLNRGTITEKEVRAYRAKMFKEQSTALPYIELQSGSNGHRHRRYIQFGELQDNPAKGTFDTFGLSRTATVPWF